MLLVCRLLIVASGWWFVGCCLLFVVCCLPCAMCCLLCIVVGCVVVCCLIVVARVLWIVCCLLVYCSLCDWCMVLVMCGVLLVVCCLPFDGWRVLCVDCFVVAVFVCGVMCAVCRFDVRCLLFVVCWVRFCCVRV